MKKIITPRAIVLAIVLAIVAVPAMADSTTGTVTLDAPVDYYVTVPEKSGQIEVTVMWSRRHDDPVVVMACGTAGVVLEYSSVATANRIIRLDAGVPGGLPCIVRVATLGNSAPFTIALWFSGGSNSSKALMKTRVDGDGAGDLLAAVDALADRIGGLSAPPN